MIENNASMYKYIQTITFMIYFKYIKNDRKISVPLNKINLKLFIHPYTFLIIFIKLSYILENNKVLK